jgi:hypothetical protein
MMNGASTPRATQSSTTRAARTSHFDTLVPNVTYAVYGSGLRAMLLG